MADFGKELNKCSGSDCYVMHHIRQGDKTETKQIKKKKEQSQGMARIHARNY